MRFKIGDIVRVSKNYENVGEYDWCPENSDGKIERITDSELMIVKWENGEYGHFKEDDDVLRLRRREI